MVEGTLGFPCKIEDDPVLALAMPDADPFPFAEERRLFYVALTRARLETWIFTTTTNPSQFVVELQKNGRLSIEDSNKQSRDACPQCGKGVLVTRSSRYGPFLACSQFPACAYKESGGATGNASAPPGKAVQSAARVDWLEGSPDSGRSLVVAAIRPAMAKHSSRTGVTHPDERTPQIRPSLAAGIQKDLTK